MQNLIELFKIGLSYVKSLAIIVRWRPHVIIVAGSYSQVPVIWAAGTLNFFKRLTRREIKIMIHQQDIVPGLANRLCARLAHKITVATKKSLTEYTVKKTVWTGNPWRAEILTGDVAMARQRFNLRSSRPILLILGGGSGAQTINELIIQNLNDLSPSVELIHVTGTNKLVRPASLVAAYHPYELLTRDLPHAYAVADLIITRAGFSTLTELTALQKPLIIIPLPDSPQEANAEYWRAADAAIVLDQHQLTGDMLLKTIRDLLANKERRFELARNASRLLPANATDRWLKVLAQIMDPAIRVTKWSE